MLAKVEADLALDKEKREVKTAKALELVKVERKAGEKAMNTYKVSADFIAEKLGQWQPSGCQRNSTTTATSSVRRLSMRASSWIGMSTIFWS